MALLAVQVVTANIEIVSSLDDSHRGNLADLVLGDAVPGVVAVAEVVLNAVAGFLDSHTGKDRVIGLLGVVRPLLGLVGVRYREKSVGTNSDELCERLDSRGCPALRRGLWGLVFVDLGVILFVLGVPRGKLFHVIEEIGAIGVHRLEHCSNLSNVCLLALTT